MATTPITLKEAIMKATEDPTTHNAPAVEVVEDEKVVVEDKVVEDKTVEKPVEKILEFPETEEQIQQALNLFRTLNNPQTAKSLISELAKTAGVQIQETKTTPKQATQTIVDMLKESLGEENEDLAVKLAPALEKLINQEIKKPLEQQSYESQALQVKNEIDSVFAKLEVELPDFAKLQNEMNSLMSDIQPGPKTSVETYLRRIYKMAGGTDKPAEKVSEKTSTKVTPAKVVAKLVQNAKETKQNVSGSVDEDRVVKSSHRPSIREAVLAAVQTLNEKS